MEGLLRLQRAPDLRQRNSLLANLLFLYHTMKASEQMLTLAVEKSKGNGLLEKYFREHLEEERGHEKWLAEDLKHADILVEETSASTNAAAMCGSIYYHLYHGDPSALLGYMLLMEGRPLSREGLLQLEKLHGKELLRTLRYHVEHDQGHAQRLKGLIDRLPEKSQEVVREAAMCSAHFFGLAMFLITLKERN